MAKVVMLVYSIDNSESFNAISNNWMDNALAADENAINVLVGNMLDLDGDEEIDRVAKSRAYTLADNLVGLNSDMVFEISALTGEGFSEMFDAIALRMLELRVVQPPSTTNFNSEGQADQESQCWSQKCSSA